MPGGEVNEMQTVGLGLLLLGLVGLLGVGVYYALAELFAADEVPFLIRLSIARGHRRVRGTDGLGRPRPDTREQDGTIRGG